MLKDVVKLQVDMNFKVGSFIFWKDLYGKKIDLLRLFFDDFLIEFI